MIIICTQSGVERNASGRFDLQSAPLLGTFFFLKQSLISEYLFTLAQSNNGNDNIRARKGITSSQSLTKVRYDKKKSFMMCLAKNLNLAVKCFITHPHKKF
eukprot:scaffold7396_cov127-Skeletonema_menzelii.AAC.5